MKLCLLNSTEIERYSFAHIIQAATQRVSEFEGITQKVEDICNAYPHTCSKDTEVFVQYDKTKRLSEVKLRFWGENPRCVCLMLMRRPQRQSVGRLLDEDDEQEEQLESIITAIPFGLDWLCFVPWFCVGVGCRMVRIKYFRGGDVQTGRDNHIERKEQLVMSMISSDRSIFEDKDLLVRWCVECFEAAVMPPVDVVEVYGLQQASKEWTPDWQLERTRVLKNNQSVGDKFYLERSQSEEILFDARLWSTSSLRIYLVVGPPGVGKSEFIVWLAGQLRLPLYRLSLYSPKLTDEVLAQVLSHSWLKHDSVLVQLDEFQSVLGRWSAHIQKENRNFEGISAAGLCEVLQGATSLSRGVIILSGTEELRCAAFQNQFPALYRRFLVTISLDWLEEGDIRMY